MAVEAGMTVEAQLWEHLKVLAWTGQLKGVRGVRAGGEPEDERDHFYTCPDCGRVIDKRDLEAVLLHEVGHDQLRDSLRIVKRRRAV
jgi:hypothetical protein